MTSKAAEKLAISLTSFLTKINDHCCKLSNTQQPFGMCIATPKSPYIAPPTKEVHAELASRAKEFFKGKQLSGLYFRYWTPPLMPKENDPPKSISADDYQLTLEVPQFDNKWLCFGKIFQISPGIPKCGVCKRYPFKMPSRTPALGTPNMFMIKADSNSNQTSLEKFHLEGFRCKQLLLIFHQN